uniref:Protocadherin beta-16-like isoform X4 n=1 Tax=Pogona vitticeps TaxID=103695 RepID=A0ABM5G9Z9_9SAUR
MEIHAGNRQVSSFFLFLCMYGAICKSIHYSMPEEKRSGSLVGNVLQDLKVDAKELSDRKAMLVSKGSRQYFQLDLHTGNVVLKEKIDREVLCGQKDPCVLLSEIVLENPLQLHRIEVEIEDVNDNFPKFSKNQFVLEIPEQTHIHTAFPLEEAQDYDKGENTIKNYTLSDNEHFRLDVQSYSDGSKYAELVLEKPLDRELTSQVSLILSAVDGGIPQRTGTTQLIIEILDNNDNVPQFGQSVYKVKLMENSPLDALVIKVEAVDSDLGSNAHITYSFSKVQESVQRAFKLNKHTGELTVGERIDYEENNNYEMTIRATDGGGLSAYCKVIVEVVDENDNAPEVTITSITSPLPEDALPGTVVALFSITDQDSGDNGRTACTSETDLPFVLKASENSYYQLETQWPLDREKVSGYNITITATDRGSPQLTSRRIITIQLTDINDNPPEFERPFYEMQLWENNIPGLLIGSVHAVDLDTEQNAKVIYSLLPGKIKDGPASSYISINSESGSLYAIRSMDYEDIKDFHVTIQAVDKGSPPLSSDVTVRIHIMDENDNAPFLLYPLQNSTSPSSDLVPRGAEAGYLVTKVVAVDRDSGQNSWLSYQLLKATEPGLFTVGAHNGEVKTLRAVNKRDAMKQNLIVVVRDNGHPPQSASTTLRILLVEGFSDPYLQIAEIPKEEATQKEDHALTLYLVVCLAAISSVFLFSILVFIAIKIQKKRKFMATYNSEPNFPAGSNTQENRMDSGTLSQAYNYEVCLAGGSLNSEFRFLRPLFPVFSMEPSNTNINPRMSCGSQEVPSHTEENQGIIQARASLSEDAAPRAGGPACTTNPTVGANVNSGQNDWLSYQ